MSSRPRVYNNKKSVKKNIFLSFASCLNGSSNTNEIPKPSKRNSLNKIKSFQKPKTKHTKSSLSIPKDSNKYLSFSSSKNTSSFFLDHTFIAAKNIVLSKLQENNNLLNDKEINKNKKTDKKQDINIKYYLRDLNKTFDLNIEVLNKFYSKDKNILKIIEKIKNKKKVKEVISKQIEKVKGAMIIEKQIQTEHKRKIAENDETYKEQINLSLDKLTVKDEYTVILLKKLRELEIFSKRKSQIIGSGYEKYKDFRIAEFIDFSNKCYIQKNFLTSEILEIKNNILEIKKENISYNNNNINSLINNKYNSKKKSDIKPNNNFQYYINYYNNKCRNLSSKIKLLKNVFKNISIQNLILINISSNIKQIEENINNEEEDNKKNNFDMKKSFLQNVSNCTSIDITNLNDDLTKRLESFIDLSIILNDNKNNEITNIIDTIHGNIIVKKANFSNVIKIN